jgi:hypothetical protein
MSKQISPVLLLGAAAAAYLLFSNSGTATAATATAASNPVSDALSSLLPATTTTTAVPTTYGVNSGVRGGVGGAYIISNYAQLLAANPNLGNPNYQMTAAEYTQYYNNYLDLEQWAASMPKNNKDQVINGIGAQMQYHWTNYGCAEKRIFLPIEPPSNIAYVPPPVAPKSSGGGLLSTVLKAATIVAGAAIEVGTAGAATPLVAAGTSAALTVESAIKGTNDNLLNDAELQLLFQGSAVLYDILPLYQNNDPVLTTAIKTKMDALLKQYA